MTLLETGTVTEPDALNKREVTGFSHGQNGHAATAAMRAISSTNFKLSPFRAGFAGASGVGLAVGVVGWFMFRSIQLGNVVSGTEG